jgi:ParB family chromosome partitioning protein
MTKSSGLGRGLRSLIPAPRTAQTADASPSFTGALHVPIERIRRNPRQPRRDFSPQEMEGLMDSVKRHGILQPLVVQDLGDQNFELVAGERRLRAAKLLGLPTVPVVLHTANDHEKLELALIENVQRQDLNAMEEAAAYKALLQEFHLTQDELAKRIGKSRPAVGNTIRLLELSPEIQQALIDGKISKTHARALLGEIDKTKREHLFHEMLLHPITAHEAEARATTHVRSYVRGLAKDPNIAAVEIQLTEKLGTRIRIHDRGGKGRMVILFDAKEKLAELIRLLSSDHPL